MTPRHITAAAQALAAALQAMRAAGCDTTATAAQGLEAIDDLVCATDRELDERDEAPMQLDLECLSPWRAEVAAHDRKLRSHPVIVRLAAE